MLDIAEQDIHMLVAQWRLVAKTVLMYFDLAWYTLAVESRPKVHIGKLNRSPIWKQLVRDNRDK
jgi:hypothetical protein